MDADQKNCCFCSACGAPLTGTLFCGQCGTKVPVMAAEIPAPVAQAVCAQDIAVAVENTDATQMTPAVQITSASEPIVQVAPRTWKFPVASVILMGIATLWFMIQLCVSQNFTWSSILYMCCNAAVLVGMIVCKKKRNLIVGFGFVTYTCAHLIVMLINTINQIQSGTDILNLVMLLLAGVIYPLCYAAFGISYLVAKPKIAVLKNIMGGFFAGVGLIGVIAMGIATIIAAIAVSLQTAVASFFNFLLYVIPVGLSVILYTPFKKR